MSVEEGTSADSTRDVMLTTVDNPFNPFLDFDAWQGFDESKGYNTCSYLARIAKVSDELTDAEEAYEIRNAIDEIVQMNVLGIYKKVYN